MLGLFRTFPHATDSALPALLAYFTDWSLMFEVVIAVEAGCLPSNFKFSESMSAVFLLRTDKAKHEDNRQETTRIYNRKNYDKVAND